MRSLVRWSILVACLLLVQASVIPAATPQAVQIQVRLQDAAGNAVSDGPHSLILTGWDDSAGGILLWTQNQVVITKQGLTQCFIESPAASAILAHSGQQYIQVQVAGEAPLLPRIRLGSVPSALLTTRMDGDVRTLPGELRISPPGSGDPDFDLLRITAVDSAATIHVGSGDPDFDLLRISTTPQSSSISMAGGDPDFDLLRITADPTGSSMVMQGDPDFDLLRIVGGVDSVASVSIGDPDFDLLRMTASPTASSMMIGDPDFDLLRLTSDNSGGSIAIEEEGVQVVRIQSGGGGGGGGGSIAVNEEGTHNIAISADSTDGDIAIDEEGVQRVHMTGGGGAATIRLNGLPPGQPVGGLITMEADSTGGSIAVEEEGVPVVHMQSGTGSGGGGGGGIAIGEEGVQVVKITSDSTGSTLSVESGGVPRAVLTVNSARKTYNYLDTFPCGLRDVEVGSLGLTMSCTPGGSTTPDTAVWIDPEGDMALAGDLSVGGDICAVGTIGVCSDARYKADITTLEGALASLERVRGVNFNWRTGEFPDKGFRADRDFGFIAQELKEVIPQVVTLGKDGYYSVDYGRLTPVLVEAVKELEARLASVEAARLAEVSVLTERLARLEAQFAKLAEGTSATTSEVALANAK